MSRHPLRPGLVTAAAAITVLTSACGAGSTTGAATPAATTPAPAASVAVASAPAPGGGDAQQFCGLVKTQLTTLQGTDLVKLIGNGSATAWKAYFDKTTAMNQQLVDAAPAQIRPSVMTLQTTTLELKDALAAAGYDMSKLGSSKLISSLQSKERVAASAALTSYVKATCKVDLSKVGG
jgi:hypothetical protein